MQDHVDGFIGNIAVDCNIRLTDSHAGQPENPTIYGHIDIFKNKIMHRA